ncbi:MAG TPA: hypothetical protein VFZ40_09590 [Pyrinomonadaceae bacterium]
MATKKASKKKAARKKKGRLIDDPPIIVGGGGSVDVNFNDNATPVSPPRGRKKFRLPNNITLVIINDGINPELQLVRVAGAFKVSFF